MEGGVEARQQRLVDVEVVTSQHALAHEFARQQLALPVLLRQALRLQTSTRVNTALQMWKRMHVRCTRLERPRHEEPDGRNEVGGRWRALVVETD